MTPISERVGSCNRMCGRCCSLSHWRAHPEYDTVKDILEAPPFLPMKENGDCPNLEWKNGMAECAIYETRPAICKDFPNHPLSTETIPDCTYTFRQ
jgi:Fe-S-cluster containining protein